MAERRVILLGKKGSGKSATGNTILMRKRFPISTGSQDTLTTECSLWQAFNKSTQVTYHVFDTPGIADNFGILPEKGYMIQQQMVQYCNEPHVFLLIVDPAACDHVMEMITALQKWFGMSILDHTIMVFTNGNQFNTDETFQSFLRKRIFSLDEDRFRRRMLKIENHGEGRSKSQRHLLSLIESTCQNGKSLFPVTPKPRYMFNRGVNERSMDNAKSKRREGLNDILIQRGTEPPRRPVQLAQRERINTLLERSDTNVPECPTECDFGHGDVFTRHLSTISEIHNEDLDTYVQCEKPHRRQDTGTTRTFLENDADRMKKKDGLKTQINDETRIVPIFQGEREYLHGTRPKAFSQTPRKPLQRKDLHRTLECAAHAGRAVKHIKESPLTSIVQLALIASNDENMEAIKNVVNSEEVQIAVANTWSFFKEAAIGVGNFVVEVAQEVEKNRQRQLQLVEEQKRRSLNMYY